MCAVTHPHRSTPGVDKEVPQSKVFIEGKNRPLFVQEAREDIDLTLDYITVTNLDGEITDIPTRKVMSVVTPKERKTPVVVPSNVFDAGGFTIRQATPDEASDYPDYTVGDIAVVLDHASAEVMFYSILDQRAIWVNPACAERSAKRYVKAIRALAEAAVLDDEANTPVDFRTDAGKVESITVPGDLVEDLEVKPGMRVEVMEGPLAGATGEVREVGGQIGPEPAVQVALDSGGTEVILATYLAAAV